ncbi:hypothetical protein ACJ41O_004297 [Fusarium nematophilum]
MSVARLCLVLAPSATSHSHRFRAAAYNGPVKNPMSPETTIQADVGPGDQTGIYYITICNLPFGTSWQHLKDWIRSTCTVDHIEVFQNSTSGWVRVKGKENFERAWGLLNGGIFGGRSIIASDKNRSQSIKIKELVDTPQLAYSHAPRYRPYPPPIQYGSPAAAPGQDYLAAYPQAGGMTFPSHSISTQSHTQQPSATTAATASSATYAAGGPRENYNYGDNSAGASSADNHAAAAAYPPQLALPYRGGAAEPPTCYDSRGIPVPASAYQTSSYVVTEPRKLHVSPFPQDAVADEVKSWLRKRVDKSTIESIEIPHSTSSRYLRGHIFVIFDSPLSATKAMDLLNGARFQGRSVIARPTVEGVTAEEARASYGADESGPSEGHATIPTGPSQTRGGDRRRGENSQRPKHRDSKKQSSTAESDKKRSSSDKKSGKKSSHSDRKPSKKSSSDKKSSSSGNTKASTSTSTSTSGTTAASSSGSGKGKDKDTGPVIVDGTSRRCDKR